jgi:Glucodextranase, domain B
VQSMGVNGKESIESERNRFTIIPRNTGADLPLNLDAFVQHGRIIEVRGRTDSSARVMVNGGEVPIINGDGSFRYMTPPLPNGENVITVTAQNAKGGVNTQTKRVVIQ